MSESANNRPPEVDLPPLQSSGPPPSPAQAKSDGVRIAVNGPIDRVVDSLSNLGRQRADPSATPGIHRRHTSSITYLAELVNDPGATGYRIEIRRNGPATWNGDELPAGVVDRCDPMLYAEILERTKQLNGGGDYRLYVLNEEGRSVQQFPFRIDTITDPPKPPRSTILSSANPGRPGYQPGFTQPGFAGQPRPLTAAAGEEDEVVKIRAEERKVAAEASLESKKRESELQRRRWNTEEEQERERKDKMALQPVVAMQNQVSVMERQMQTMLQAMQQQAQQSQQQMQQFMMAMMQKPQDNSSTALIIESMKSTSQMMMQMMQMQQATSQTKQNDSLEAMRLQAAQQKEIMELAVRSASGGNTRYDKLIESMIHAQVSAPKDNVKNALDLIETGRRQTMEMLEMREQFGPNEDELEYDPENSLLGNFGRIAFAGIKALLKGGGGAAGIAQVMAMLGKSDPAQVQTSDLTRLAATLEQQQHAQQQHQLNLQQRKQQLAAPPPLGIPAFGAPSQRPIAMPPQPQQQQAAPRPFAPAPAPAAAPAQPKPQARRLVLNNPQNKVLVEEVMEEVESVQQDDGLGAPEATVPVAAPVALPPAPASAPGQVFSNARLQAVVTEAMRMATEDLTEGVREHEWPDMALAKWPKTFLDEFCKAADDSIRVQLIQRVCDPAVFNEMYQKLVDQTAPTGYTAFVEGLHTVVADHTQSVLPVAAN